MAMSTVLYLIGFESLNTTSGILLSSCRWLFVCLQLVSFQFIFNAVVCFFKDSFQNTHTHTHTHAHARLSRAYVSHTHMHKYTIKVRRRRLAQTDVEPRRVRRCLPWVSQSISGQSTRKLTTNDSQSIGQSVSQPVSHSVSQPVSQSIGQSISQSVGQSVSQSASRSVSQSVSQSVNRLTHIYIYICIYVFICVYRYMCVMLACAHRCIHTCVHPSRAYVCVCALVYIHNEEQR